MQDHKNTNQVWLN